MEFNGFIFPAPSLDYHMIKIYRNELIYIPSNDPKESYYIPCLFLKNQKSENFKNFVIFFHGNAEDIFLSRSMAYGLLEKLDMNIIVVEYPGYSVYKGDPDADKILKNTWIVYDFVKKTFKLEDKNIFVFGRSIGTSPAIYLASVRSPNALLVVSSFTSIRAVAGNLVGPLKYLLKNRFLSEEYIKNVKCPIMFIHGKSDPLIPYKESEELKKLCTSYSEISLPEHMTHNDFDLETDIMEPIGKFINKNCVVDEEKSDIFNNNEELKKLYKMPEEINSFIKENLK